MKIQYVTKRFKPETLALIDQCNAIINQYRAQNLILTVRQLYYRLVATGLVPNSLRSYKRVAARVADGREAGLIDWSAIEDRTRQVRGNPHWDKPLDILDSAYHSYQVDMWTNQPFRPEVWIEKDALTGVIDGICRELDVPYFSCRGYASASEVWKAGHHRFRRQLADDQRPYIIHLGDHDPSGLDMTRDIAERLARYTRRPVQVERVALNMDQVEQYDPPPNPAKLSDSRAGVYVAEFGYSSWELDALDPPVLRQIISDQVTLITDADLWEERVAEYEEQKQELYDIIYPNGQEDES